MSPERVTVDRFSWEKGLRSEDGPKRTQLLVLLVLASYMDADGTGARVSQATLAAGAGLGERAVREHLTSAEAAGWVMVEHRGHRRGDGTAMASSYRACVPPQAARRFRLTSVSTGTVDPVERSSTGTVDPVERSSTGTVVPLERTSTGTVDPVERTSTGTGAPVETSQPAPPRVSTGTGVPPTIRDQEQRGGGNGTARDDLLDRAAAIVRWDPERVPGLIEGLRVTHGDGPVDDVVAKIISRGATYQRPRDLVAAIDQDLGATRRQPVGPTDPTVDAFHRRSEYARAEPTTGEPCPDCGEPVDLMPNGTRYCGTCSVAREPARQLADSRARVAQGRA